MCAVSVISCSAIAYTDDVATVTATPLCRAPVVGVLELLPPLPRLEMPETETAQCNWPHWLAVVNCISVATTAESGFSDFTTGRTAFKKL